MNKYKKWLIPGLSILLTLAVIFGGFGCTPDARQPDGSLPSLGEIFDPSGNPLGHSFSDMLPTGVQGEVVYHDGDNWVSLGVGAAGEYLKTQGAAADPIWAAGAGGGDVSAAGVPADSEVAIWTDATTIEGADLGGRIIVAADDSSAAAKVAALASGGAVCNTVDDEVELLAAIAIANNTGGTVFLPSGTYYVESADLEVDGCLLLGENVIRGDGTIIIANHPRRIIVSNKGDIRRCTLQTNSLPATKDFLVLDVTAASESFSWMHGAFDDLLIINSSADRTGNGFHAYITGDVAVDRAIARCEFGSIFIEGFEYAWRATLDDNGGTTWMNHNSFRYIYTDQCDYQVYIDNTDGDAVNINIWQGVFQQFQEPDTVGGFYLIGNCDQNIIFIETSDVAVTDSLNVGVGCSANLIIGRLVQWTDNGANTTILSSGSWDKLNMKADGTQYWSGRTLSDADHSWTGDTKRLTAGENIAFPNVCYLKNDGEFYKTDADAEATTKGWVLLCVHTLTDGNDGVFLRRGLARDDTWTWTAGDTLWIDNATAGGLRNTAPPSGDYARIVGYAVSDDVIYFDPDHYYELIP